MHPSAENAQRAYARRNAAMLLNTAVLGLTHDKEHREQGGALKASRMPVAWSIHTWVKVFGLPSVLSVT